MNNKLVAGIVIAAIAVVGTVYFLSRDGSDNGNGPDNSPKLQVSPTATPIGTPVENGADGKGTVQETTREFIVEGTPFAFSIKEMSVDQGDTVRVTFRNKVGFHDWVIDEFNARTKQLQAGQEQTIEFVANKTGTFEYYCSVGNHRQQGMVGKLIVR